ncbi:NAD-dependent epimerase/dehydratase family protein [Natronocalculus amylovorans]|uniref:NAD-dependent epimerase/dehydratase family protein n=1 Tax=Natronocalculus amylovorans TaxID=2917812 RepID=A0AAE3FTP5_9EURY|nr:NAD-dependent epimerase/dehydratase family protein [Natronocalculus amylovorans]MCL9815437.1 NAD-dependent epimerase/dehydratase family protein [Natronocalculus amylovorans]
MGKTALVIGGTRFIGRHTVSDLLDHEYDVTIFNRGNHDNPFADDDRVTHIAGDRTDRSALASAAESVTPDVVIDCVAYQPEDVAAAVDVFDAVDGYVYISSGAAYGAEIIPKRENRTPLRPCSDEQAIDDSGETYGNRKAEGDRIIFEAAKSGVNAMAVRPCIVYGPYDYTERLDYWIDRVANYDRIIVPGDGQNIWHRGYAGDVASALRIVAEEGEPGEAYNVGDQELVTIEEMVDLIADALKTEIEVVAAGERELAAGGLAPTDFILYREYPHILSTSKLAALGWESTSLSEAMADTVAEHRESDRNGSEYDPGREAEERVLAILDTL